MTFLEKIEPYTADKTLSFWQIAKDGIWEDAIRIDADANSDQITPTLDANINDATKDIAIEAFFGDVDDGIEFFFFGIRLEQLETEDKIDFIKKLISACDKRNNINAVITTTSRLIGQRLLNTPPLMLELGAEGFWKSYGSYKVWGDDKPLSTIQDIETYAPQLKYPFKRPIMLEFAWDTPHPIWLGIPVSRQISSHEFLFCDEIYKHLSSLGVK